jgi:hypothetical protein
MQEREERSFHLREPTASIVPSDTTSKKAEATLLSLPDEEILRRIKALRQSKDQAKLLDRMSERISRGSEECEKLITEKTFGIQAQLQKHFEQ